MKTPASRPGLAIAALAALSAATVLGACSSDGDSTTTAGSVTPTTSVGTTQAKSGTLEITGVWARTSPAMASAGAAYLEITNGTDTDDALLSASVEPSVAGKVELHETTAAMTDGTGMTGTTAMNGSGMTDDTGMTTTSMMTDGTGMTGTTMAGSGMMQMKPVDRVPVPAGETAALKPGGYHIMLLELPEPLEVGATFELTLTFEEAGEIVVTATVRDTAP